MICEFVEGSRCQGCKIDIFEAGTTTQIRALAAQRINGASSATQCLNTQQLPSGEYHVHISDIENDGSHSGTAITLAFTVHNPEQSSMSLTFIFYK